MACRECVKSAVFDGLGSCAEKGGGFYVPHGYGEVESDAFFCATTETVKDRALDTLSTRHTAPPHHLENLAETKPPETTEEEVAATLAADKDWEALSPHARTTALAHVEVYLDDFISITQGGSKRETTDDTESLPCHHLNNL